MKKLHGTGVALVTPFNQDGTIDFESFEKLLVHTGKYVDYFVVMGTTGESATLSAEEKHEVLQFVLHHNPKKLPVVYGIGGNNTHQVVHEIEQTSFKGVTALLSVSPYYNKPTQKGIYQHYKAIAAASPVPVILYNVPGRTASNISATTTLRLAKLDKIIGSKEASCDIEQMTHILRDRPRGFMVISGDDMLTFNVYAMGGEGVISVLANALPDVFQKMKKAIDLGQYKRAAMLQSNMLEIFPLIFQEGNPTGIKCCLHQLNVCQPYVRLPLTEASTKLTKEISKIVQTMNKKVK